MSFFIYLIYFVSILMFLNVANIISFWLMLEINLVLFIVVSLEAKASPDTYLDSFQVSLFYFIVQTISSVFILYFSIFFGSSLSEMSGIGVLMCLAVKSGLVPFHFWVYKVGEFFGSLPFFLLLTFQKIPFFLFVGFMDFSSTIMIMVLNLIVGSLFVLTSTSLTSLMLSSSIYSTIWMYASYMLSFDLFIFFFLFYSGSIFFICINLKVYSNSMQQKSFLLGCTLFFLMGLPPFSFFFFKLYILYFIYSFFNYFLVLLLWMGSFLSLIGYFIIMNKSLYFSENCYSLISTNFDFYLCLSVCLLFFFFF